ncbi:hypothetical protein LUZ60_002200 [Juncus effusus]|nr:hypothetical protein LUZ60_002200 [Juncus effusus]
MAAEKDKAGKESIVFCKGVNGLDKVVLTNPKGCTAEVYLYGAQVTSWKNERGEEYLFMSNKAIFKPPKPIRGGIPVCFPQFGTYGHLEQHGFARNKMWKVEERPPVFLKKFPDSTEASDTYVDLALFPSEDDTRVYPFTWELRLRVILGLSGDLILIPRVRNMNLEGKNMNFGFALHSYFRISDISEIRLEGLETMDYFDHTSNKKRFTEQGDALTFENEIDKAYLETPDKVAIIDHEKKRTFVVRKQGLPDMVVWNPWDKKAKSIPDLGDEEYRRMLCVEPAIIERPIVLKPGEEWTGHVEFIVVPSSYCSGQLDPQKVLNPTRAS